MVLLAVQFVSVCVMLGQPIISVEQNIYLSLQVYKFLMLFKRIFVKYLLYVHSFHKILEMSSVPNSQSVAQFFYKKYSVSVQSVLRIFLKSTRFQFSRFYGYFRKVVGWILVGFEKFSKSSRFFLVGFGLSFKNQSVFRQSVLPIFPKSTRF